MKKELILLFLILTIPYISAESVCIPNTDSLCKNSVELGGYLYCNIEDVKTCNNGCMVLNGNDYCYSWINKIFIEIKEFFSKTF